MAPHLPDEVLLKILGYIEPSAMHKIVLLAQVNRQYRRLALSNPVWARFDVHGVRRADPQPIYTYNGYTLSGIAADFMIWLSSCPKEHQKLFFQGTPSYVQALCPEDRYSQLHTLCVFEEAEGDPWDYAHLAVVLACVEQSVWDLWIAGLPEHRRVEGYGWVSAFELEYREEFLQNFEDCLPEEPWPTTMNYWDLNVALACSEAREYVHYKLWRHREFLIQVLPETHRAGMWLPFDRLKDLCRTHFDDREVVLAAVHVDGRLLSCAPKWRKDRQILLVAAMHDTFLERFPEMRDDRELVLQAVRANFPSLKYASERLRRNEEIAAAAIVNARDFLERVERGTSDLRGREPHVDPWPPERIETFIKCASLFADGSLSTNKDRALEVIRRHPEYLGYASAAFRGDPAIVRAALKADGSSIVYATRALNNSEFIRGHLTERAAFLTNVKDHAERERVIISMRSVLDEVPDISLNLEFERQIMQLQKEFSFQL